MGNSSKEQILEVIRDFSELAEDTAIPGNLRQKASLAIVILQNGENNLEHKKSQLSSILEEMVNDPNIDPFVRTNLLTLETRVHSL